VFAVFRHPAVWTKALTVETIALSNDVNTIHHYRDSLFEVVGLAEGKQKAVKAGAESLNHAPTNDRALFRRQSRKVFMELLIRRCFPVAASKKVVILDRFIPKILDDELTEFVRCGAAFHGTLLDIYHETLQANAGSAGNIVFPDQACPVE
jgi:hypothetical protein